jgi:hypothetical protein
MEPDEYVITKKEKENIGGLKEQRRPRTAFVSANKEDRLCSLVVRVPCC